MKDRIKAKINNFFTSPILLILLVGLIVRLLLAWFGTLKLDQGTFVAWSHNLVEGGFGHFYEGWSDYLPGYLYVLWILAKIKTAIPVPEVLLYKLPAILADMATGYLIYRIVRKIKGEKLGLISASFYLFNPAGFYNSTLWGQIDSLTSFFSLLAIYLAGVNPILSATSLTLGTLIKPQAVLAAPVIFWLALKRKWTLRDYLLAFSSSFLVFILLFLPFAGEKNLFAFIYQRVLVTLNQYPYSSVNAFNFWGFFGFWNSDKFILSPSLIGITITGIFSLVTLIKVWKKKGGEYYLATVIFISSFLFFSRMHERHLLPTLAPLAIISAFNPSLWLVYVGLSLTYIANLYYSFIWISKDFLSVYPPFLIKVFILLNLGLFAFLFKETLSKKEKRLSFSWMRQGFKVFLAPSVSVKKKILFPTLKLSKSNAKIFLLVIIIFSLASRLAWLWQPEKEYFDEVYHAFTAKLVLHQDPKAWEWWNPHPEGFAYEWTHPPLAKLGMALGMLVLGENALGWRLPGAILGVAAVYLVYLIAKYLFQDEWLGILSSGTFALEGLPLVMSRISMNDSYLLAFMLLSFYLYLKEKNFLSAIAFGLALSSKWSVIWAVPIFILTHFVFQRKIRISYVWFLILPPLIYLASYTQMFITGHNFETFIGMQKQMWWYHTGLRATHPYTSPWWSWPFLARPIYLYTSEEINGWVSRIYAIGNPFVFWFGLAAVLVCCYFAFKIRLSARGEREGFVAKKLALVTFSYLVFFVPWAASPRIMFLYHYLPSVPFLAIAVGFVLRQFPKLILITLLLSFIAFIYFYPHWAGLPVPLWLDKTYYWFSSWR